MRGITVGWAFGARWQRSIAVLATTLATLGTLCALTASPALALVGEFGEEGEGAGQFVEADGIAVNQESGDVYLADTANDRIVQFSGEGQFLRAWGFGVSDGSSEAFQVCEAPGPCFAGKPGTAGGQLSQPKGIAIDNSAGLTHGDVYVQDTVNHRVERFGPEGEFILTFGGEVNKTKVEAKASEAEQNVCSAASGDQCQAGTSGPGASQFESFGRNGIAVGPGGTVYVADFARVQKFAPSGAPEGEIALPETGVISGLEVDSVGDLYALRETLEGVHKYDGSGKELGEVRDPGAGGLAPSIALGPSDQLLVSDPVQERVLTYEASGTQLESLTLPGASDARGGIAFANASKALYLLHNTPARVTLLTLPAPGPVILSEGTSALLPTCATLKATINPEGPEPTHYHFQYGTSTAYGSESAETLLEGGAFEDQAASATVCGLQPATTYHFRAVATNGTQTTLGTDQSFTSAPSVSVDEESATNVSATSAKLNAQLNAHGLPSEFHFEYGLSSAYEKSAPVPEGSAGESSEDVPVSVKIGELLPNHTYHYRVVAHNSLGVSLGPDRTFTTQGQVGVLADGRAYEMVSPPNKHGISLEAITREGGLIEAAADGSGLAYIGLGPIDEDPAGNRSSQVSQLVAKRGTGVWSTQDIATPHQAPAGVTTGNPSEYKQFSADLARGAVEPEGATPLSPQSSERTPYRREADGSYTPLVSASNVPAGTKFGGKELAESFSGGVTLISGTADMSHILLRAPTSLVQGFENEGQESIYEWNEGTLQAVSILPSGAPASEEGAASAGNEDVQVRGAISEDGTRVFFGTHNSRRLYVRDTALGQSLRVDAAEAGVKASNGEATFQMASGDGSKVLFTDANRLTKDSTAKAGAADLYQCTIVVPGGKLACQLRDLSVDPQTGEAADVRGDVLGADPSLHEVYFVARGALADGAGKGSCPSEEGGQCFNLYGEDTQTLSKRLVAVLSEKDIPDWRAGNNGIDLGEMTARVSPNGRYVAFMSQRSLTGFDNRDASPQAQEAQDEEVFLYDNETAAVRCASCDPSGQRPAGAFDDGQFPGLLVERRGDWQGSWLAASVPGWTRIDLTHALHQSRYLSNEGRLFFNSPVGLVAGDGNGTQDVYEYEPQKVGSCESAQGCVNLISSGSSSEESALLDASENGADVFFLSAAQLSTADEDNAFDVYDAHICSVGGCPAQALGSPPPCASADACRAASTPQPGAFSAPASSTFEGAGNPTPPPPPAKAKLTRAQQLAKALQACKKKPKRKRAACERQARKRFGAHKAKKAKAKARRAGAKKRGQK